MRKDNSLLRSARIDRQWTADFVSEQVGVTRSTYIRWETGLQLPRHTSLKALCKIFSLSPEQLGFKKSPALSSSQQRVGQAQVDASPADVVDISALRQSPTEDRVEALASSSLEDVKTTQPVSAPMLDVWVEDIAFCWEH